MSELGLWHMAGPNIGQTSHYLTISEPTECAMSGRFTLFIACFIIELIFNSLSLGDRWIIRSVLGPGPVLFWLQLQSLAGTGQFVVSIKNYNKTRQYFDHWAELRWGGLSCHFRCQGQPTLSSEQWGGPDWTKLVPSPGLTRWQHHITSELRYNICFPPSR